MDHLVEAGKPTLSKMVSRENAIVILGAVMIVCLALTIVTGVVALIFIGQPFGNAAGITAAIFASIFSISFFSAFVLRMTEERSRDKTSASDLKRTLISNSADQKQN